VLFVRSEFLAGARSAHASSRVQLFEWHKASWSYHAKGLWLTLARASQPQLTMIGSPNFGARSVQRDTETALVMLTRDGSPLSHALAAEKQSLLQQCKLVTLDGHNPEDSSSGAAETAVKPPMWVCALSKLARPYM
jgi:CDP-diacylglycerol--glycerol-3-phosphate 3-phosphatidyltransferase